MSAHHHHAHHHAKDHTEDLDWEAMATQLERGAELQIPFLEAAAGWLRDLLLTDGREIAGIGRILDVGSGPGVVSCLLARAFPYAEVVAVDGTPSLLERARARADREGLTDRVQTHQADLPEGLGSLGTADLIWTSRALHHLGDQQAAVDALARSLRPGGLLAVAEGGLAPRYLPRDIGMGRPGLQARLEAASEDWFAAMRASLPGSTEAIEDWPAMLARAGLASTGTRTFLTDLPAPLDQPAREHLHAQLTRLHETVGEQLDPEDLKTLGKLLDHDARTGILHRPDAFYLTATTVHTARAPRPS